MTPSDRISHRIHIVWTSYSQLPARSEIFYLLVEVVYGHCCLQFVYLTITLTFLSIIVKVKLPAKFWMILSPNKLWRKIFYLSCPKHCDEGLIFVIAWWWWWSSSSYRAASMDIPDPLSPLLPIIHRLWLVFRATSRILT